MACAHDLVYVSTLESMVEEVELVAGAAAVVLVETATDVVEGIEVVSEAGTEVVQDAENSATIRNATVNLT